MSVFGITRPTATTAEPTSRLISPGSLPHVPPCSSVRVETERAGWGRMGTNPALNRQMEAVSHWAIGLFGSK